MRKLTQNLSSYKEFLGSFQKIKALALRILDGKNVDTTKNNLKEDLQLASNVIRKSDGPERQEPPLVQWNSFKGFENSETQSVYEPAQFYQYKLEFPNRATKSEILILALGPIGQEYDKPEKHSSKIDLTWADPIELASGSKALKTKSKAPALQNRFKLDTAHAVQSLQHLLALYVEHVSSKVEESEQWEQALVDENDLDTSLLYVFQQQNLEFLKLKGYDVEDLLTWTWILAANTADKAARRLTAYSHHVQQNIHVGQPLPTFLYLFLLRRRNFSSRGLRLLILHGWDRLLFQSKFEAPNDSTNETTETTLYPKTTEPSLIVMFIRLIRHAREVWPVAFISITAMMTRHINGTDTGSSIPKQLADQDTARITFIYNKALSLLSTPALLRPFRSVRYQQQAQFQIIRKMNEFQPALIIDREGYRAMVSVQLAHMKTPSERRWAEMKAKSWPPWKEEKTGLDGNIGIEHGRSRAGEILLRAKEAGYAPQDWEKIAGVSAGWDTDRSPTIQTRTPIQRPQRSRFPFDPRTEVTDIECNAFLWAGRVQSTRTLDEAWACFLSYKRSGAQPVQAVYFSLFEKIHFHEKMTRTRKRESRLNSEKPLDEAVEKPLPGDGRETWPNPGPSEAIYVRTPAPNKQEFSEMMINDKIRPSGRFLNFLLSNTRSFTEGVRYLNMSPLSAEIIEALLNEDASKDENFSSTISAVDIHLHTSVIRFLVQSALSSSKPAKRILHLTSSAPKWPSSIRQAFRLMELRKPLYLPPWYSLFQALVDPCMTIDTGSHVSDENSQRVSKWEVMCNLLDKMEEIELHIDFEGFRLLCLCLEKALIANQKLLQTSNRAADSADVNGFDHCRKEHSGHQPIDSIQSLSQKTLSEGLSLLKYHFKRLVDPNSGGEDPNRNHELSGTMHESLVVEAHFDSVTMLPRVQELFHTSHLHAFIRVLGVGCDYHGILELLKWMHHYAPEVKSTVEETFNSSRLARRCIVAVGAFLERGPFHIYDRVEGHFDGGASPEILEDAFNFIEKHEDWGGWPTNEEIDNYCNSYCTKIIIS